MRLNLWATAGEWEPLDNESLSIEYYRTYGVI